MKSLEEMQAEITEVNHANGWFVTERTFGDDIALLTTELGEAFDAYRTWEFADVTGRNGTDKPEGVGSEAADILIRLLDMCERRSINLASEYERKIAYNRTRGYKHGGKIL